MVRVLLLYSGYRQHILSLTHTLEIKITKKDEL